MIGLLLIAVSLGGLVLVFAGSYVYGRGYEDGRRDERQAIDRAAGELQQRAAVAQRHIDYLYERARREISQGGEGGSSRER